MKRVLAQIIAIALKELTVLWRDRQALALLFAMPLFFIIVMSYALEGVFEAGSKGRPIQVIVVNEDEGALAAEAVLDLRKTEGLLLLETIGGARITAERAEQLVRDQAYPMALMFRRDFSRRLTTANDTATSGQMPCVVLMVDPAMNRQLVAPVKGVIQGDIERRHVMAVIPQRINDAFERMSEKAGDVHCIFG